MATRKRIMAGLLVDVFLSVKRFPALIVAGTEPSFVFFIYCVSPSFCSIIIAPCSASSFATKIFDKEQVVYISSYLIGSFKSTAIFLSEVW